MSLIDDDCSDNDRVAIPDIRGTWRIVGSQCFREVSDVGGLEGCEVTFHGAELSWRKTDAAENNPLTQCESYEMSVQGRTNVLKFVYSVGNQIIPFKMKMPHQDCLVLRYESACELRCVRVGLESRVAGKPYSLTDALNEGYFSDVSIRSVDGSVFAAHELVLSARFREATWWKAADFAPMMPAFALRALLTYAYSECLPNDLSEENVKRTLKLVRKWATHEQTIRGFACFVDLCELFLKNTALKQNVRSLLDDVQSCLERVTDLFSGKFVLNQLRAAATAQQAGLQSSSNADTDTGASSETKSNLFCGIEVELIGDQLAADWLVSNPQLMVKVLKLSVKECVVMMCKMAIICDLFARRKTNLTRQERYEIMKYTKVRVQTAIGQAETLLAVLKRHCDELTHEQRAELAQHLVGHTETILNLIPDFLVESRAAFEQALKVVTGTEQVSSPSTSGLQTTGAGIASTSMQSEESSKSSGNTLTRLIKNLIHVKEVLKMKSWYEKATRLVERCTEKRDLFAEMSHDQKVLVLDKALEIVVDEAGWSVLRVRGLADEFDTTVRWRDWKYWFKLVSSKVSWAIGKLLAHRDILRPIMTRVIDNVNSDEFRNCLISMGLYVELSSAFGAAAAPSQSQTSSVAVGAAAASGTSHCTLPSAESLCRPPSARDSEVAKQCYALLNCAVSTDLVFEFATTHEKVSTLTSTGSGDTSDSSTLFSKPKGEAICVCGLPHCDNVTEIHAHRVVLAARSDWFKSALLSGMREAIDQRITVHDCTPHAFKLFLNYLYTNQPIPNASASYAEPELTLDDTADLLYLADLYSEKELKRHCEDVLIYHVHKMERALTHRSAPNATPNSSSRSLGSLLNAGPGTSSSTIDDSKSVNIGISVGDDVIVALLSAAEQCNAERLREEVVFYMLRHPDVIRRHATEFGQLPSTLQEEIRSLINSRVVPIERSPKRVVKPASPPESSLISPFSAANRPPIDHFESDADDDSNSGYESFDADRDVQGRLARPAAQRFLATDMHTRSHQHRRFWDDGVSAGHGDPDRSSDEQAHSSSSSNDEDAEDVEALIRTRLGLPDSTVQRTRADEMEAAAYGDEDVDAQLSRAVDSQRLESCIVQLDEILSGLEEPPSRQQLIQYIIAADYDVNRAVNFIFK